MCTDDKHRPAWGPWGFISVSEGDTGPTHPAGSRPLTDPSAASCAAAWLSWRWRPHSVRRSQGIRPTARSVTSGPSSAAKGRRRPAGAGPWRRCARWGTVVLSTTVPKCCSVTVELRPRCSVRRRALWTSTLKRALVMQTSDCAARCWPLRSGAPRPPRCSTARTARAAPTGPGPGRPSRRPRRRVQHGRPPTGSPWVAVSGTGVFSGIGCLRLVYPAGPMKSSGLPGSGWPRSGERRATEILNRDRPDG